MDPASNAATIRDATDDHAYTITLDPFNSTPTRTNIRARGIYVAVIPFYAVVVIFAF